MDEEPNTKPTVKGFFEEVCGELAIHLALLGLFLLVGNVYLAYIFFGFGTLFLILPFGMIFYYLLKKYGTQQKISDENQKNSD